MRALLKTGKGYFWSECLFRVGGSHGASRYTIHDLSYTRCGTYCLAYNAFKLPSIFSLR